MKPNIIAAFDPGKTTGWATVEVVADAVGPVYHGETQDIKEIVDVCNIAQTVICESYNPRMRFNNAVEPIKVIGVIEYFSEPRFQTPDMGKLFWTNRYLKKVGIYPKGEHARDAVRHLLYYVSFSLRERHFLNLLGEEDDD